jgi:CheY-like chemotaxis protein
VNRFILFAEDDVEQAELISIACEKAGVPDSAYFICRDGLQLISFLRKSLSQRQRLPRPTRVVTDLKMPLLDGIGVVEWIRGNPAFKDLPVSVFTSSCDPELKTQAEDSGCSEFVEKTAIIGDFVGLLRRWYGVPVESSASDLVANSAPASYELR